MVLKELEALLAKPWRNLCVVSGGTLQKVRNAYIYKNTCSRRNYSDYSRRQILLTAKIFKFAVDVICQ